MVLRVGFVSAYAGRCAEWRRRQNRRRSASLVIGRVEHLRIFQNHFDNVLIAVPPRTAANFTGKKEDIHCGKYRLPEDAFQFF